MPPFIKNNRRLIFSLIVLILLGAALVFAFLVGPDRNIFALQMAYPEALSLRLSPTELQTLNDSRAGEWVRAELVDRAEIPIPVQIRSLYRRYGLDFQVELGGYVYHLFQLNDERRPVYNGYRRLEDPGFRVALTRPLRLEINQVMIGIYVAEAKIYDQVRNPEGEYGLRIGSDTHFMRRLRADLAFGRGELLETSFDLESLSRFMIFLYRIGFRPQHDFGRLVIRFDPRRERFIPLLTLESLLSFTDDEESSFAFLENFQWDPRTAPRDGEGEDLLIAFQGTEYFDLISRVIELGEKKPEGR